MTLRTLFAAILTLPAVAHGAPGVSLDLQDGAFVDADSGLVTGWVTGADTSHLVTINGQATGFVPTIDADGDGVADSGPFQLPMVDAGSGLGQILSAMHTVRAEVLEPFGLGMRLVAADQVAFYDTSELGGHAEPRGAWHPHGVEFRITDGGLDAVAELAAQTLISAHADELVPRVQAAFPAGPDVDEPMPVAACDHLDNLGLGPDDLQVSGSQFGLSAGDFALIPGSMLKLCMVRVTADVDLDLDDLLTDRPDLDLDGEMDPLVSLDSRAGYVDATLTLGPVEASAYATVQFTLSIEPALIVFPTLTPSAVRIDLEFGCDATIAAPFSRVSADLDLDGTGTSEVDVSHLSFDLDLELEGTFGGLCAPMTVYAAVLEDPIEDVLEEVLEDVLSDPTQGVPLVDDAIERALADVGFEAEVPVGETASLDVSAVIASIAEDPQGVTVAFESRATRGDLDPFYSLAPNQPHAYAPWATGTSFAASEPYDVGVFAEAAQLDQILHAAFEAGVFHRELSVEGDLVELGVAVGPDLGRALDAARLEGFLDGLGLPGSTPLVIRMGPELAPIVAVEDTNSPPYTMRASMFGVHMSVVDPTTEEVWLQSVSDLKADVTLSLDAAGDLTAQLTNPVFTTELVGSDLDLASQAVKPGFQALLQQWVQQQLASQVVSVPLPSLTVPTGLEPKPVIDVDATQTLTVHSGQEAYATVAVE